MNGTTSTTTDATVATLTRAADVLRNHPHLPAPYLTIFPSRPDEVDVNWYLHINDRGDEQQQRDLAREIIRSIGGTWAKEFDDKVARFTHSRDGIKYEVQVVRDAVCIRRVVGFETVTIPAQDAVPPRPERVETRELVEWDCTPVLGEAVTR